MKRYLLPVVAFLAGFASLFLFVRMAQAEDAGAVPAFQPGTVTTVDAGVPAPDQGSAVVTSTTTTTTAVVPSDSLHNPIDSPSAAIEDAKQAKKQGWASFILVLIIMVTAAFAKASTKWPATPVLSTINKHKTLIFVIACFGVGSTAVYNAVTGGSWYAALLAGGVAVVAFINAAPSTPAPAPNAAKA